MTRRPTDEQDDCEHLTDLDRLASGDTSPALWARIEAHVPTCVHCADALAFFVEERLDSGQPIERAAPPVMTLPKPRLWIVPLALAASLLIAAGITAIVAQWAPAPTLTAKGDPDTIPPADALFVVRVHPDGVPERLEPGDQVSEGDRLGLIYSIERDAHLLVFSVDREAPPTLIFPLNDRPPNVSAGLEKPLDVGARVGPPPLRRELSTCEWLVGVFSDSPLDVDAVRSNLSVPTSSGCAFNPTIPGARKVVVFPTRR